MPSTTPSPYLIRRNGDFRPGDGTQAIPIFFDQQEQRLDFWSYWCTIRNHIGLIAGLVAVAVLSTLLWVITAMPTYTAGTILLIDSRPPHVFTPKEGSATEDPGPPPVEFFETQVEILRSRSLALDVIRNLDLGENSFFVGEAPDQPNILWKWWTKIGTWLGRSEAANRLTSLLTPLVGLLGQNETRAKSAPQTVDETDAEQEQLVNAYLGGLRVEPVESTNLVQVSFTSPSPALSAKIANEHAGAYVAQGIRIRSQANVQAAHFLQRKLVELKAKLEESETTLNDYRRARGIIPGLMSLDGKETVVIDRLADLSKDLTAAQVARIGLEAEVETIRRHDYDSLPAVVGSEQIRTLKSQLSQLISEYAGMENEFTSNYSPLAALGARIEEVKRDLQREIGTVIASIRTAYQGAVEKENRLKAEMDLQRKVALTLNDATVRYTILSRDVDTNRELYNSVLQRMKDIGVAAEVQTSNVSIIDRASVPSVPSSPRPRRDLVLSAVLAMMGGLGLAFLIDYFDDSLRTPEEAESYLGVPVLGVVPEFPAERRNKGLWGPPWWVRLLPTNKNPLLSAKVLNAAVAEAYRHIRTGLQLSRAASPPKLTLVTSACPGEGKTVTAVNTAIFLAGCNARVLLVDADLRRSRCHEVLQCENREGLTEVLTGLVKLDDVIRQTRIKTLFLLSTGSRAPNPAELLGSAAMRQTLTRLEAQFDYVVIDSAPVMPVSDATILSTMVDGVVLVVATAATSKSHVRAALAKLRYARAKVFGIVLNRAQLQTPNYAHYYTHVHYLEHEEGSAAQLLRTPPESERRV